MRINKISVLIFLMILFFFDMRGGPLNYKVMDAVFTNGSERRIMRIACETRCTTMFVLPEKESVADIVEPTGEWMVNCDNKRFVYVVPLKRGIHTSLDIVTSGSSVYSFILEEVSGRPDPPDIAKKVIIRKGIRFSAAAAEERGGFPAEPSPGRKLYSRYKIRDRHFNVTRVEDDGILTKIYMRKSQVRPAVFIRESGRGSRYEPVRYRDFGDYYLVHRVPGPKEQIVLKAGKKESSIRRK